MKRKIGLIALAVVAATSLVAQAQTTPTGTRPTADRPSVTSPYWNPPSGENGALTPAGIQTLDEPGRLVAQTITAVPQARADYVVAKWTYRRINRDLNRATNFLRDDFRTSDDYVKATDELNAAYAEYTAAREEAVRGVRATDDYRAAEELRQNLSEQITELAALPSEKRDVDQMAALAALKIDYITPMRTVEREMINASPAVANARTRLRNAAREVSRLEKDFARDVRDSITLSDLRRSREDARIASLSAYAYLDEARIARDAAYYYALVSRRAERLTPRLGNYGYGYGGYGYYGGYGTYRGVGGFAN